MLKLVGINQANRFPPTTQTKRVGYRFPNSIQTVVQNVLQNLLGTLLLLLLLDILAVGDQLIGALPPPIGLECGSVDRQKKIK